MEVDVIWLCLRVLTAFAVAAECRLDVNVALNRPAYQSSTFVDTYHGIYFFASYANDGNNETDLYAGTCAHSDLETNPWWAVDLGVKLHITGIHFVNRLSGDSSYRRSDNFIVGLTDVSPAVTPPTLWTYEVCGQHPGSVPDGATVYLKCRCKLPPHRYLIIQFPQTTYSNFCEVKVYTNRWHYKQTVGYKMNGKEADTFQVEHRIYCMIKCIESPICDSYNFRSSDKTCQFNTHDTPLIANSADIVADGAWDWWITDFTTVQ